MNVRAVVYSIFLWLLLAVNSTATTGWQYPTYIENTDPPKFTLEIKDGKLIAVDRNGKEDKKSEFSGNPLVYDEEGNELDFSARDESEDIDIQYTDYLRIQMTRRDNDGTATIEVDQTATDVTLHLTYSYYEGWQIMHAHPIIHKTIVCKSFDELLENHDFRRMFDEDILPCFKQQDLMAQKFEAAKFIQKLCIKYNIQVIDSKTKKEYDKLIHDLDDDEWEIRDKAETKLRSYGMPAGLYLITINIDKLTPEQQSRVWSIIGSFYR